MRAPLLSLAVALALLPAAGAEECVPTTSTTGWEQVVVGPDPVLGVYVASDNCQPECLLSTWYYVESNDIPGLQRHDKRVDDTCGWLIDSDTIIS